MFYLISGMFYLISLVIASSECKSYLGKIDFLKFLFLFILLSHPKQKRTDFMCNIGAALHATYDNFTYYLLMPS